MVTLPVSFNRHATVPVSRQRQLSDRAEVSRLTTSIGKQPITRKRWVPNLVFSFGSNTERTLSPIQPRSKTALSQQHTVANYVKNLANNQFDAQFFMYVDVEYIYGFVMLGVCTASR